MVGASSQQKWQMTICKLSYQFRGSLVNDDVTLGKSHARFAGSDSDRGGRENVCSMPSLVQHYFFFPGASSGLR
jgi:hypothetical protein